MWTKIKVGDNSAGYSQVGEDSYPHSAIDDMLDEPDAPNLEEDDISERMMDATPPAITTSEPIGMSPVEQSNTPIGATIAARERH